MLKIIACTIAAATALKVGCLSDTHIKLAYDEAVNKSNYCQKKLGNPKDKTLAPFGRYKCDPPPALVEEMFKHYKRAWGNPDVILFTGDHVAHYIAARKPGREE